MKKEKDKNSILRVTDTSKFGTSVNEKRYKGATVDCPTGSTIQFGVDPNVYQVDFNKLVFCTSSISEKAEMRDIKEMASKIGILTNKFEQATHLVMKELVITHKSLISIIKGIHIISKNWMQAILEDKKIIKKLPSYQEFGFSFL